MRKIECKKSKYHGFYEEGAECPMCEPDEELCPEALDIFQRQLDTVMRRVYQGGYNTLSHGQDWGAATGEEILADLDSMIRVLTRK